jgi:adenylate cyclase
MQLGSTSVQRLRVIWVTRALIALLAFGFAVLLEWQRPAYLVRIDEGLRDSFLRIAAQTAPEERLVVVDIDEKSTQALGAWPWPRDRMAQLLNGLDAYGVNLKVVDVLFDGEQNAAQDAKLASALKSGAAPTVISQLFALSPDAQVKSGQLASAMAMQSTCPTASTIAFRYCVSGSSGCTGWSGPAPA